MKYFKALLKHFIGLFMSIFGNFFLRNSLVVICYHDINESPSEFSKSNSLDLNPELFRKQLLFLKSNFNIISPDDLISGNIPKRAVLITFDDGWRSTFEVAIPIMKELKIPSILFLNMAPVKGSLFFPGLVDYFIRNYDNFPKFLNENIEDTKKYPLHTNCTIELLNSFIDSEKSINNSTLSNYIGVFASEEMLKKYENNSYVYYGNHFLNHYVSRHLNEIEFEEEYILNSRLLEKYNNYRKIVAFPYGQPNSCFSKEQVTQLFNFEVQHIFASSGHVGHDIKFKFIDRISFTASHSTEIKMWQQLGIGFFKEKLSPISNIK